MREWSKNVWCRRWKRSYRKKESSCGDVRETKRVKNMEKSEWWECMKERWWGVLGQHKGMTKVRLLERQDVEERNEKASTEWKAQIGKESVALRHSAAGAALTDNRSLTTDCLFVLPDWMTGWLDAAVSLQLCPSPHLPLCLSPSLSGSLSNAAPSFFLDEWEHLWFQFNFRK